MCHMSVLLHALKSTSFFSRKSATMELRIMASSEVREGLRDDGLDNDSGWRMASSLVPFGEDCNILLRAYAQRRCKMFLFE